ncbi:MAG: sulfotransferase, partial [Anaerolineales bacterium]
MPKFPPDATHPPIFIVGSPRSGTTLLRNLLRSHPRLTFPEESHFIPTYYKKYGNPKNEREACKLAEAILNLQFIRDWGLSITPSTFSGMRSYADIVDRLFEEWARSEQKPRWGDKTPHYVTQIPTLVEIFPACKIIHVIRDGRDVALSWMRFGYGPNNLYTAAKAWARFVAAGQEDGKKLPGETYLEVRYEALIQQPEKTLRQVCAFLDEDFHPDTLKPTHLPVSGTRRYTPKQVPG